MFNASAIALVFSLGLVSVTAKDYLLHSFKKQQLTQEFWSEGANFGDFNHDGVMDIASGPYWYEGPGFTNRHEFYPANESFSREKSDGSGERVRGFEGALGKKNNYSDNFFAFVYDFNHDGWPDVMIYGFPGTGASWYENPKGREGHWQRHVVFDMVDNESPAFGDLTGSGKPQIICCSSGYIGYASADWEHPEKPWKFHPITPKGSWQRFTHGLGFGDVNGDGRADILEMNGWWEQPASLTNDPVWKFHAFPFAPGEGSSQMYAYDINGDGKADVITALAAHGYGLAWFEQTATDAGEITFKKHIILEPESGKTAPAPDKYGVVFSELHAVTLVDMDGDGLKDIVTGKRYWAHGHGGDVDSEGPSVIYWFKLTRLADGGVAFVPHLIDDNSGVGTQLVTGNIQNKKFPDIVVGNKRGTFFLHHETKSVSKAEWEAAQPKPLAK